MSADLAVMSVPSVPRSVAQLRRFAVAACVEHGFGDTCDTLELLVSEVATNALLHGRGDVCVSVLPGTGLVRVEVADDSDAVPVARHAGTDAESGRGLALLEQLSDRWGVDTGRGQGKVVWFELDALPQPARQALLCTPRGGGRRA